MGHTVVIDSKSIELHEDTKKIRDILSQALACLGEKSNHTGLDATIEVDKPGLKGKILQIGEFILGTLQGSKSVVFPSRQYDLDPPAAHLLESYIHYLNVLLISVGREAKDSEAKTLNDRFSFVRELLIRIVTEALSIKTDNVSHGETMLAVLKRFIYELIHSDILNHYPNNILINKRLSNFNIALATNHPSWIFAFDSMVSAIGSLHLHTTAISSAITYFNEIKRNLARMIISTLDPYKKDCELNDYWVLTVLASSERSWLKNHESTLKNYIPTIDHTSQPISYIKNQLTKMTIQEKKAPHFLSDSFEPTSNLSWNTTTKQKIHHMILYVFNKKLSDAQNKHGLQSKEYHEAKSLKEKIDVYYTLFFKTNLLMQAVEKINTILIIGGWIPILTGVLNMTDLSNLIGEHQIQYQTIVKDLEDAFVKNVKSGSFQGLLKHLNAIPINNLATSVTENLLLLESEYIKSQIIELLNSQVNQLISIQNNINIENKSYRLVKLEHLKNILPSDVVQKCQLLTNTHGSESLRLRKQPNTIYLNYEFKIPYKILETEKSCDLFNLAGLDRYETLLEIYKIAILDQNSREIKPLLGEIAYWITTDIDKLNYCPLSLLQDAEYKQLRKEHFDTANAKKNNLIDHSKKYQDFALRFLKTYLDDFLTGQGKSGYRPIIYFNDMKSNSILNTISMVKGINITIYTQLKNLDSTQNVDKEPKIYICPIADFSPNKRTAVNLLLDETNLLLLLEINDSLHLCESETIKMHVLRNRYKPSHYPLITSNIYVNLEQSLALKNAVTKNDNKSVVAILQNQKVSANQTCHNNWSLLALACSEGYFEVVNSLLIFGANPNHSLQNTLSWSGWTPLAIAIYLGHIQIVDSLLSMNANPNHSLDYPCSHYGWTPLSLAIHLIQEHKDNPTKIEAYHQTIELLLKYNANPNHSIVCQSKRGMTPLTLALEYEDTISVLLLLKYGADPNHIIDSRCYNSEFIGLTPLDLIFLNYSPTNIIHLLKAFLRSGALVKCYLKNGKSPLEQAEKILPPTHFENISHLLSAPTENETYFVHVSFDTISHHLKPLASFMTKGQHIQIRTHLNNISFFKSYRPHSMIKLHSSQAIDELLNQCHSSIDHNEKVIIKSQNFDSLHTLAQELMILGICKQLLRPLLCEDSDDYFINLSKSEFTQIKGEDAYNSLATQYQSMTTPNITN